MTTSKTLAIASAAALTVLAAGASSPFQASQSAPALERTAENARRSGLVNVETKRANVFELLPELVRAGRGFDSAVLDPPALASSKDTVPRAPAAYKELNLRAMRLVRPPGRGVRPA